ncbi:IS5 family transposase [Candidatus Lariskella endosymbiont of Epinotia ramella]|uniref:IS5 family transposase n=1 Tax=Candidatus Lariskella endosymbiont of Epinotia ramella TaxID=3066224 RepID=UPI0030CE747C
MARLNKLRKGKYKVINWSEYSKGLESRGDITIWFTKEAIESWIEKASINRSIGRQKQYSDLAIQTIYTIRQVFNLRLRQSEGFVRSILKILNISLPTPDYTTISRRVRSILVDFVTTKPTGKVNIILDSTGIKVLGEKEWTNYKHGTRQRRIWRKLHIAVTDDGNIIAGEVTKLRDSDIATVPKLLDQIDNKVQKIVGDGAYYKKRMLYYMQCCSNTSASCFVGPPKDGSKNYGNRLKVEETFSRYKRIIGNKFKAIHFLAQQNEAKLSLLILNQMKDIGMPKTIRIP